MFAQVNGLTTCGIDGVMILIEVDISNGLPNFDLVGLPAMAVRESKERVKAAHQRNWCWFRKPGIFAAPMRSRSGIGGS